MRNTTKMTLAALASLALIPMLSVAATVKAPYPGTITTLTYYPSGTFHGAVDITSGQSCGYWGVETGLMGSFYWNVLIRSADTTCTIVTQNEAKHAFSDGTVYRIMNFIKTAASYSKTCDRCLIGDEGLNTHSTHLQVDKSGTRDTSWYSSYSTKGEYVDRTETIGVF